MTAFCPNPDGAGTVLRVWEQAGKGGTITVTLPKGMKATSARPVNLRGEPAGEPIAIVGNSGEYTSGPHLHFELWHDRVPVNPELYIPF